MGMWRAVCLIDSVGMKEGGGEKQGREGLERGKRGKRGKTRLLRETEG